VTVGFGGGELVLVPLAASLPGPPDRQPDADGAHAAERADVLLAEARTRASAASCIALVHLGRLDDRYELDCARAATYDVEASYRSTRPAWCPRLARRSLSRASLRRRLFTAETKGLPPRVAVRRDNRERRSKD